MLRECSSKKESEIMEREEIEHEGGRTKAQDKLRYKNMYDRKTSSNKGVVSTVLHVPILLSPLSLSTLTLETPTSSTSDSRYTGDMIPLTTSPTSI